jgi:excisionase family DNA binding protein
MLSYATYFGVAPRIAPGGMHKRAASRMGSMTTMDGDTTLMSVSDAARRLQRSTEQVRRYLREGRLEGRRIGGQWFIDRSTLDAFATESRQQRTFVERLDSARTVRPLDDVIGIGEGPGSNIGEGKSAYRQAATRRRT